MVKIWKFSHVLTTWGFDLMMRFKGSKGKVCKLMTSHFGTIMQSPGCLRKCNKSVQLAIWLPFLSLMGDLAGTGSGNRLDQETSGFSLLFIFYFNFILLHFFDVTQVDWLWSKVALSANKGMAPYILTLKINCHELPIRVTARPIRNKIVRNNLTTVLGQWRWLPTKSFSNVQLE